jgi:hypothetical protein
LAPGFRLLEDVTLDEALKKCKDDLKGSFGAVDIKKFVNCTKKGCRHVRARGRFFKNPYFDFRTSLLHEFLKK